MGKKTEVTKAAKTRKKARAMDLRLAGHTYATIAEKIGCSISSAQRYVVEAMDDANADAKAGAMRLRKIMNARLEKLILALWADACEAESYEERRRSIRELVKLLDRQAKLLGLDAPRAIEATVKSLQSVDPEEAEQAFLDAVEKFKGG